MKTMMIRIILVAVAVVGLLLAGGCEKALFPERLPRTQYERYDRLRGQYTPTERMTASGLPEPALRERLSPYRP